MNLKQDSKTAPAVAWDPEAERALERVPFFVRKLVRRKVGEQVAGRGGNRVTLSDFLEAEAHFRAVSGGKGAEELKSMMPADNEPGVEMAVVTACHAKLSGCPNVLLDTDEWKGAVEKWIAEKGLNEKLRARVPGRKVLYHHKLKIAVSGCPNGCSRPQIADIGIVGYVIPFVDPAECTFCGACEDACPDDAISAIGAAPLFDMSKCQGCVSCRDICPNNCIDIAPRGVRILLGGKLGRHPHLAELSGSVETPAELVGRLDSIMDDYLANGRTGERFSDHRIRMKKGGGNER